jgi:hypothetical protein
MKKHKIIYWVSTAFIALLIGSSGTFYFVNPDLKAAFVHLGFPDYFRVELGAAKILGALALLIPALPNWAKEWAYAGVGIVLVSASVAHYATGDGIAQSLTPLLFLGILAVSYTYYHKLRQPELAKA